MFLSVFYFLAEQLDHFKEILLLVSPINCLWLHYIAKIALVCLRELVFNMLVVNLTGAFILYFS